MDPCKNIYISRVGTGIKRIQILIKIILNNIFTYFSYQLLTQMAKNFKSLHTMTDIDKETFKKHVEVGIIVFILKIL